MSFTPEQITNLSAKLDPKNVATRSQSGRSLSYVEGWHVIAEANRIFGYDAWDRELVSMKLLGEPRAVDGKQRVGYMATVRITVRAGETVTVRDGTGFGSGIDKDIDQAHESALKEAETDAMKRAMMTFGNPFGLALYDKTQASVGVEQPEAQRQPPKPADGTYRTAGGFERKPAPRLSGDDAPTIRDALMRAMDMSGTIEVLDSWVKGQMGQIDSLPDADFDTFKLAFLAYRKTLRKDAA